MIKKAKISSIKPNPDNPRIIKDDAFHKLVKSIKEFPEMLDIRPIVVNSEMIVLGGNMRLRACKEAGLKEVPIIKADKLTPEQQREFIIKDNVSGGEWDWDILANEWETDDLSKWGLDVPNIEADFEYQADVAAPEFEYPEDLPGSSIKMVQLFLTTETEPIFRKCELELRAQLKTENITDTIYTAIKKMAEDGTSD